MIASIAAPVDQTSSSSVNGAPGAGSTVGNLASKSQKPDSDKKLREAAKQFEQVLVKQMLKPLEESLSKAMGTESANPMIGSLVLDTVSDSISKGGGLGFADVIEQALRSKNLGSSEEK